MSGEIDQAFRDGIAQMKATFGPGGLMAAVALWKPAGSPAPRNPDGTPLRTVRVPLTAIVADANKLLRTPTGTEFVAMTSVQFLEPVDVGPDDAVELPDGTIPELQLIDRGVLPETGGPLTVTIYCG